MPGWACCRVSISRAAVPQAGRPAILRRELARPGYRCAPIALGINTDAYQPVERRLGLTRALVEVLAEHGHPFSVVSKSALVERDVDLLVPLAAQGLVQVAVSVTTLDSALARRLEPRAATPARCIETIRRLSGSGIPVCVLAAGYVLLRLPHEVRELFHDWLAVHEPLEAARRGRVRRPAEPALPPRLPPPRLSRRAAARLRPLPRAGAAGAVRVVLKVVVSIRYFDIEQQKHLFVRCICLA